MRGAAASWRLWRAPQDPFREPSSLLLGEVTYPLSRLLLGQAGFPGMVCGGVADREARGIWPSAAPCPVQFLDAQELADVPS